MLETNFGGTLLNIFDIYLSFFVDIWQQHISKQHMHEQLSHALMSQQWKPLLL